MNIAYNVGAFTPTLFTMMVIMAQMTTMLTAPILNLLGIKNPEGQVARISISTGTRSAPVVLRNGPPDGVKVFDRLRR